MLSTGSHLRNVLYARSYSNIYKSVICEQPKLLGQGWVIYSILSNNPTCIHWLVGTTPHYTISHTLDSAIP